MQFVLESGHIVFAENLFESITLVVIFEDMSNHFGNKSLFESLKSFVAGF